MDNEVDLILFSSVVGNVLVDLAYRQLENLNRRGRASEEATRWLREVSSPVNAEGKSQRPINFDTIDQDIRLLVSLKEQLDKQLGIYEGDNQEDIPTSPLV